MTLLNINFMVELQKKKYTNLICDKFESAWVSDLGVLHLKSPTNHQLEIWFNSSALYIKYNDIVITIIMLVLVLWE